MTDREMLELAAKAAGITNLMLGNYSDEYGFPFSGADDDNETYQWWNPFTDDGDALRLAVKLGLDVCIDTDMEDVPRTQVIVFIGTSSSPFDKVELHGDKYAATRRAIVRAAAEIGAQL